VIGWRLLQQFRRRLTGPPLAEEGVTADVLRLISARDCNALSLGLPGIACALVCAGPRSTVRAWDPAAGRYRAYGPADRIEVLIQVGRQLAWTEAGTPLWAGEGFTASALTLPNSVHLVLPILELAARGPAGSRRECAVRGSGSQVIPERVGAGGPGSEEAPVDQVQVLLSSEGAGRGGDAAVGDQDGDVGAVDRAGGAVEDLQVPGAHRGAGVAVAAVFALDDPAPAVGVGGPDVGAQVTAAADPHGIPAAVAAQQRLDGVFELAVMQGVQLQQRVAQTAVLQRPLPGLTAIPVRPAAAGRGGECRGEDEHPPMGRQPDGRLRRQGDGRDCCCQGREPYCVGRPLAPAAASAASAALARPPGHCRPPGRGSGFEGASRAATALLCVIVGACAPMVMGDAARIVPAGERGLPRVHAP
jgi:hypothetical protein